MTPSVGACNSVRNPADLHVVQGHTLGASSRPYTRVLKGAPRGNPLTLKVQLRGNQKPVCPCPSGYVWGVRRMASPQCGGNVRGRGSVCGL